MTAYALPAEEIRILRDLARRQAEIAALPVQADRERLWTAMNDAVPGARPPFAIESWTFDRDFMPPDLFQCTTEYGRRLERNFLRAIRHHEILGDDHVCPDTLDMHWHTWHDEFGLEIETERVKDAEGVETGYHFIHPIKDLDEDGIEMLRPATFGVDREATLAEKTFLEATFGDILPVVLRGPSPGHCLTQLLMPLMGMEAFFTAMYDCPDTLHELMGLLRDNGRRHAAWAEAEGLLTLNNGNQCTCGTCYNFTTLLPERTIPAGETVRLSDLWAGMNSQETVGVSPELFHEFCFPYYRDLAELYGLVYWGCCEPADPIWETSLRHLPNLKAVSISRWADEEFMTEALAGTGIVYSRKPDPNLLGVDVTLNEEAWRQEIRTTLALTAARDIPTEFVVRDVYSMHGNLAKARRAVEIAREEIDRVYDPVPCG